MSVESAADRAYMLNVSDFGTAVTDGTTADVGIEDLETEALFGQAQVLGLRHSVLVRASVYTALRVGAAFTVNGTAYTVADRHKEPPDGLFTRVWLKG